MRGGSHNFASSMGRGALTPSCITRHILELSERLVDPYMIRRLGLELHRPSFEIDATLYDNRHAIQEAAYRMLADWSKSVEDSYVRWITLRDALSKSGLNVFIVDILEREF